MGRIIVLALIAAVFWVPCIPMSAVITYNSDLTRGQQIGVIIGCYVFLFIIVAIVAEWWLNRRRTP